ncbi:hypothetical protein M422DRAFT_274733 [Sphaerobolus stellatus SS14]|uniref:Uncharacterized protein n=1 Tax=Sphaerobolus stellatus (strain SS14) TaxID=990650 RepID=A0A0C9UH25_SPHS4|nr:hypothetical protein M422DRAFT_274733 [Sphaerobolus stellatus SS14]
MSRCRTVTPSHRRRRRCIPAATQAVSSVDNLRLKSLCLLHEDCPGEELLKSRRIRFLNLGPFDLLLFPFMFPVLLSVTARNSGQGEACWSSSDAMMVEDNS